MSEAPDYARKLMGVRRWHVESDGLLHSTGVHRHDLWPPKADRKATCLAMQGRTAKAVIERDDFHFAPNEDCVCGLYAWVNLETCLQHGTVPCSPLVPYIGGVVSARGEVIYAGYGFRAEYMSIEALIIGEENITLFNEEISLMPAYRRLAKLYDVPLLYDPEVMPFMMDMGVVLDAYVPEDEEPEEESGHTKGVQALPGAIGAFKAGTPIQAGAQLAYNPTNGTVHHRLRMDAPLGIAAHSAKAGELVSVASKSMITAAHSFTPMEPIDIEWKYARNALWVAGWVGIIGMAVFAYAVVRNVGGMYLLWLALEIFSAVGFLVVCKMLRLGG
jgi:hypothetical protein